MDFVKITSRTAKRGTIEVYPKFIITNKSQDLMIRGRDFYAIWMADRNLWSTDEQDALNAIDRELDNYISDNKERFENENVRVLHMWDAETGMIDAWHKYCQKQCRDNFHMLDEKIIFSNMDVSKTDYVSKKLNYPLEEGAHDAYDHLMSVLYSPEERHKIEWAIGSIVCGDSKKIQKFVVLYGAAGTGKSTVLNIIQQLFDGYYSVFDARALGSSSNSFALEAFNSNPLVAIQHDGDLSRIEDNTRLNSLVSHEAMTVNEKFKATYTNRFKSFLFMGTNKPVKITDAKSGLIRRLIDVSPTGEKLPSSDYRSTMKKIGFELGHIADYCQKVYLADPGAYDNYVPTLMMGASNDFYNYVIDSYYIFDHDNGVTLHNAWEMYKKYCDDAKVGYPMSRRAFQEELKNYFEEYKERYILSDGTRVRSYYLGFLKEKVDGYPDWGEEQKEEPKQKLIEFKSQKSIFDKTCANCIAQYAKRRNEQDIPEEAWLDVRTRLCDLDTSKTHYVKVPVNHIVIDFDIPDPTTGEKSFERNLEAASQWPPTYAELSKSGKGIHLHYIYTGGDPEKLSRVYDDHIEIKVYSGKASLRRKLTKCNDIPIAEINSGLPLKGEEKVVNFKALANEKAIRTVIKRNLAKEYFPNTKPSVDFIKKVLDDAYASGMNYDVSDMYNAIMAFAAQSTHQAKYCMSVVDKMKFKSNEPSSESHAEHDQLVFFDCEVFSNLFLVNWKIQGEGKPVVRMINPTAAEIENLVKYKLVGFNNRRYDNHMLYGRMIGYSCEQLFKLSQRIVSNDKTAFFGEAYNLSYTDIYDFSSKKQSLKKFEIELGIHHQELGLPWDKPVPEEMWAKVAEYCDNDVIATEAVFNARKADFTARQILADIAGMTPNDTTNSLTTRIIFGKNRSPQNEFNYRNLAEPVPYTRYAEYRKKFGDNYIFHIFDENGLPLFEDYDGTSPLPEGYSILPFFPGYKFEKGVSTYLGSEIGEGGRVFGAPGMYTNVWDGDVASMHPHSLIFEVGFGPKYTQRFKELVDIRVMIKHKEFDKAKHLLNGSLTKYLNDPDMAKDLAQALKIAINSVYGLTSASFTNPCRDPRNIDNLVAKRGALFMTLLKQEVEKRGFKVAHIKTDSIKIPNATQEIKDFVCKFGKEYGYTFETEADFEKYCLVNNAVYIAKERGAKWTAVGAQFQVPYVYKTLFSHEPIIFDDMCETKSVTSALYLDCNEGLPEGEHNYHFVGRIGLFCPMKPNCGAGIESYSGDLVREAKVKGKNGEPDSIKYDSATGAKGYRWMESEMVKTLGKEKYIDRSYYDAMVNEAVSTISQYGDFEWFISDDPVPPPDDLPPWETQEEEERRSFAVR